MVSKLPIIRKQTVEEEALAQVSVRTVPGRGRCVFAAAAIPRGVLVERAPCLRIPRSVSHREAQRAVQHQLLQQRIGQQLAMLRRQGAFSDFAPP